MGFASLYPSYALSQNTPDHHPWSVPMSERDYDIMKEFAYLVQSAFPPPFLAAGIGDTTLVVLGTSVLDEFLKMVLVAGFMSGAVSKRRVEQVFGSEGALGTFSAKIGLATLLGLTHENSSHDLKILRKIRNSFAHSHEQLHLRDFSSCLALKMVSRLTIVDDVEERLKFKQSCAAIMGQLATATMIRNAQYRFMTKNPEGVKKEYEEMVKEAEAVGASPPPE
jgi:energy-converting hydrogenase Eha subunit A